MRDKTPLQFKRIAILVPKEIKKIRIRNLEGYCLLDVSKSEQKQVGYKQNSSECLG